MKNLPRKFNPGLNQDDKSFIAQYVVRLPLLKTLLETISDNTHAPICQHRLYYGPRGRGKTMLMARVAAEVRVNPKFSEHWIPIRLLEESYYEISNIAEFWLEVMSELTLSIPSELKANAELALQHLKDNWTHPDLEQMAQVAVLEQLNKLGKKAIIMLENLHQLIDETGDDFGWAIRRVMQNEPNIMFLTTATTRFDNLDNASKPFFEIFATSELKRLKRSDVAILWNTLTKTEKTEQEVAPLDILTGGSPRLLNIVAQFAQENSIRELMENLTGLVDEYTEYFKSQADALAPKERRVFLALADLWKESSAKEISERARMDIRSTSALLGRLEHKGALKVNAEMPRRKMYSIAERLFCIYYKLRRERSSDALIESLVQFMVDFYTPEEIDKIKELHLSKDILLKEERLFLDKLDLATEIKVSTNVNEVKEVSASLKKDLEFIAGKMHEAKQAYDKKEFEKALIGFKTLINRYQERKETSIIEWIAKVKFNQALTYRKLGDINKVLIGYETLIKQYQERTETPIVCIVARAIFNQAITYGLQGNFDKELMGYKALIQHYQNRTEKLIIEVVINAMHNQAMTYAKQKNINNALETYKTLINRYQEHNEPSIVKTVTMALTNQAHLLTTQKNWKLAESSYQQALSHVENIKFNEHDILVSTASLGQLISQQAATLSGLQQSCLIKVIQAASQQPAAEERMALAIGIAAVLPNELALSIIQASIGHEALQPLIVTLQQEMGEKVRTSEEILEVAVDVQLRMQEMREKYCTAQ